MLPRSRLTLSSRDSTTFFWTVNLSFKRSTYTSLSLWLFIPPVAFVFSDAVRDQCRRMATNGELPSTTITSQAKIGVCDVTLSNNLVDHRRN